jgi:hypothetical protein
MTNRSNSSSHNRRGKGINMQSHTDEAIVYEYFRLIKNKDIDRLLDLFAEDAIVYEPFSKTGDSVGLQGKTAIKPFLNIAIMANVGLQYQIEFKESRPKIYNGNDQITTTVTFESVEKVKARFTFKLSSEEIYDSQKKKKIQYLYIQFVK